MKLFVFLAFAIIGSSAFHYHGDETVSDWPTLYPTCSGSFQSPINIDTSSVKQLSDLYPDMELVLSDDYLTSNVEGYWENNGHSIQFTLYVPGDQYIKAEANGFLSANYVLTQFHFHWGSNNSVGSEHTIDNEQFPLEMHLVHIKEDYLTNSTLALVDPEGYMVISQLFTVGDKKSKNLKQVFKYVNKVVELDVEETLDTSLKLGKALSFKSWIVGDYYAYRGGFTTPDCNEVVNWIVMAHPMEISPKALKAFRKAVDDDGHQLVDNFRYPQDLAGRDVYRSF